MNKQLFFGQYKRIGSYFAGSELASTGLPRRARNWRSSKPCATRCRRKSSPQPYTNPVGGTPGERAHQSARSAAAAEGGRLRNPQPEARQPQDRRAVQRRNPCRPTRRSSASRCSTSPRSSGSASSVDVRTVDDAQYENRLRAVGFRHDRRAVGAIAVARQRAARLLGLAGRRSGRARAITSASRIPAVDALIERIIFAKNRDELVAATRALDRVLLWNHYVVPQWTYGKPRTARWDRFGHPDKLPRIRRPPAFPDLLVVGRGKAAKTAVAAVSRGRDATN